MPRTSDEVPAAFEREFRHARTEIPETAERPKSVQLRKPALSNGPQEARNHQLFARKAERLVGNLENALSLHRRSERIQAKRGSGKTKKRETCLPTFAGKRLKQGSSGPYAPSIQTREMLLCLKHRKAWRTHPCFQQTGR
jgi:hypothetical protein